MSNILDTLFLDNDLRTWLIAFFAFLLSFFFLQLLKRILLKRVSSLAAKTRNQIDDLFLQLILQTRTIFLLAVAVYLGTQFLTLTPSARELLRLLTLMVLFLQIGFWGSGVITYLVKRKVQEEMEEKDTATATAINAFGMVLRGAVWVIVTLFALDNIPGVEVNSLVASLGITGIAVALAVQNTLGDLFASLSIVLDKPFVIGDGIAINDITGTVEQIGLKSTRIRSTTGEQVIIANADLLKNHIRNYKKMQRRRQVFTIGVSYQTPADKLAAIPEIIREIVTSHEMVTFDRAHLKTLGDFAIIFEAVYYLETPAYSTLMDRQQSIYLKLLKRLETEGIELAYPTQTVILKK